MKDATLTPAIEMLETARESGIAPSQLKKLVELTGQKGPYDDRFADFLQSPLYPDLLEALGQGTIEDVDRTVFRHILGLERKKGGYYPVITITGEWDIQPHLPDWVKKVERDATEPTGTLELEFLALLEEGESSISGEEMVSRAEDRGADLGLRHALAFKEAYKTESFGLPSGTWIPFPGTIVVHRDGYRHVPYLHWGGPRWILRCDWLEPDWDSNGRLARPRV